VSASSIFVLKAAWQLPASFSGKVQMEQQSRRNVSCGMGSDHYIALLQECILNRISCKSSLMNDDKILPEVLDAFFAYISDNEGTGHYSLGLELEFYERNSFHPAIANRLYGIFGYSVNGFESPLGIKLPDGSYAEAGRNAAYGRSAAIQLRNHLRGKFGKPELDDYELREFALGGPPFSEFSNAPGMSRAKITRVYDTTETERNAALAYAFGKYPEVIEYSRGIRNLAPAQGYHDCDVYGCSLTKAYAAASLYAVLPSLQEYSDVTGVDDVEGLFFD